MSTINNIQQSQTQVQQATKAAAQRVAGSSGAPDSPHDGDSDDRVTISVRGKELAKASQGGSDALAKVEAGVSPAASSKAKLTTAVQDTKVKIKSLENKIQAEKNLPGGADDAKTINARLSTLNTTLAQDKARLYTV
ncbi:hypothetical protein dsx2_2297 [Desulfovibrio sp. X2]|uniref:hypothetical protein n=1 Tax=Desulfovibrio sp. X2 TaxID=941449 RepID=UPI000358EA59|nr:hypothetical protein [Desulfovibrio sp. X2]EPR43446.1 hypothetical protein dsx2_2297 [Desulfovibrio sp. X2]